LADLVEGGEPFNVYGRDPHDIIYVNDVVAESYPGTEFWCWFDFKRNFVVGETATTQHFVIDTFPTPNGVSLFIDFYSGYPFQPDFDKIKIIDKNEMYGAVDDHVAYRALDISLGI
jgi:hypothetical protein